LAGSAARWIIDLGVTSAAGNSWPIGILLVNLSGSFLMGYVVGHGFGRWPAWLRLGVTTGFLGSYTTLSAISLSVVLTVNTGGLDGVGIAALYATASIVLGVTVALWGLRLGGRRSEAVSP
jgi:CrcB protein